MLSRVFLTGNQKAYELVLVFKPETGSHTYKAASPKPLQLAYRCGFLFLFLFMSGETSARKHFYGPFPDAIFIYKFFNSFQKKNSVYYGSNELFFILCLGNMFYCFYIGTTNRVS